MDTISLPQLLNAPNCTETIQFSESLDGFDTLMPVKGWIKLTHQGTYLDVSAQAETIVTLVCDRCLQQYNHRLSIAVSEMIWFQSKSDDDLYEPGSEIEVALEDLIETLAPEGMFESAAWLYEHLCLALPQRKLCDEDCDGIEIPHNANETNHAPIDHRWSGLESLKQYL